MQQQEILQRCLNLGTKAYEQEVLRSEITGKKADYLMKYYVLLVSILNLSLPLILKYLTVERFEKRMVIYLITMAVILFGIISTLLIQKPRKIKLYPTGVMILKEIQADGECFQTEDEWIYRELLYMELRTNSLEKANERAVLWMVVSYVCFVFSIIGITIFFFNVML